MAVILDSYIMSDGWEFRLLPGINLQWHRGPSYKWFRIQIAWLLFYFAVEFHFNYRLKRGK